MFYFLVTSSSLIFFLCFVLILPQPIPLHQLVEVEGFTVIGRHGAIGSDRLEVGYRHATGWQLPGFWS